MMVRLLFDLVNESSDSKTLPMILAEYVWRAMLFQILMKKRVRFELVHHFCSDMFVQDVGRKEICA
jgi:hypothetical protein